MSKNAGKTDPQKKATSSALRKSPRLKSGKAGGACFICGETGHYAKSCPRKGVAGKTEKSPAVSEKARAEYGRLAKLPGRPGGYYPDGRAVIEDYAGAGASWALSPTVGKAGLWDAGPIERRQAAYEADLRALWDRSRRTASGIETFNSLVASFGGAAASALGASNPAGAASGAFGVARGGGAPSGRPPLARRLEALARLQRQGAQKRAKGIGIDGLTDGERWGVRANARDYAVKWWYTALRGTESADTPPPKSTADLLRALPGVTGNPMAAKWVVEAAYKDVRRRLTETRRVEANEKELREKYINDIRASGESVEGVENVVTPLLRLWRDRVADRGAYGPTGAYMLGKVGEASAVYGRSGTGEITREAAKRGAMESVIREWMPDAEVAPGTPYRIVLKLYRTARARREASDERGLK